MADFREKVLDKVYTVGYNLWRVEAFAEQVKALDATVVDVRYRPNSRNPDWRAGSLLKRLGRAYVWMPEFGNRNYKGGPIELVNPVPQGFYFSGRLDMWLWGGVFHAGQSGRKGDCARPGVY